jgi:hypothetical protein
LTSDADFDDDDLYIDGPPEAAHALKGQMGVESDYFDAIAPDPGEEEVKSLRDELVELVR